MHDSASYRFLLLVLLIFHVGHMSHKNKIIVIYSSTQHYNWNT